MYTNSTVADVSHESAIRCSCLLFRDIKETRYCNGLSFRTSSGQKLVGMAHCQRCGRSIGTRNNALRRTVRNRRSACARAEDTNDVEESRAYKLPLFPLEVVALPGCTTSLHIFEARYRVLFTTLIDDGNTSEIEQSLVDDSKDASAFRGTRKFGMVHSQGSGRMNAIGTLLEITEHKPVGDGRMLVSCKGIEKIEVKDVEVGSDSVTYGFVEPVPDLPDMPSPNDTESLDELANRVRESMRVILRHNQQQQSSSSSSDDNQEASSTAELARRVEEEIDSLSPAMLSFRVAGYFDAFDSGSGQRIDQALLEMPAARQRLKQELSVLRAPVDYIQAQNVAQDVLSGSGSNNSSEGEQQQQGDEGEGDQSGEQDKQSE